MLGVLLSIIVVAPVWLLRLGVALYLGRLSNSELEKLELGFLVDCTGPVDRWNALRKAREQPKVTAFL